MFGFKSKKEQRAEMLAEVQEQLRIEKEAADKAEVERRQAILKAEENAREEERTRIAAEEAAREAEVAKMKESEEPWVEVKGMVQDPDKGIKIDLDWNDAFVKHLRENGYVGTSDDQVVQRYIAVLAKQVAEDMSGGQINENE
jgi:hypothetical protein